MSSFFDPFMRQAVLLAEKGRWHTAPNPVVGAVLVKDGQIVASGYHEKFGMGHAEVNCLADARAKGVDPSQCTLCVTLEPCNHQGKTPPCAPAVLDAGIRHVVIGTMDVNLEATGGAAFLREHGVEVEVGVLEEECRDLIADFIVWRNSQRPYLILKMASTLDGMIATRTGRGEQISCDESMAEVQRLREGVACAHGAVLIGGETFVSDNPRLTVRTGSDVAQPLAVVILSRLPLPGTSFHILDERPEDCVFFTTVTQAASPAAADIRSKGGRVYGIDRNQDGIGLNLKQMMTLLREKENRLYVLCEGGGRLGMSFLKDRLVDEFHLHLAPLVVGDVEAKSVFSGASVASMAKAYRMRFVDFSKVGRDVHLRLRPVYEEHTVN